MLQWEGLFKSEIELSKAAKFERKLPRRWTLISNFFNVWGVVILVACITGSAYLGGSGESGLIMSIWPVSFLHRRDATAYIATCTVFRVL